MTILLTVVSLIVAITSLLFSGWQARILSRQTALQNATAGMSTLQQLFTWLHNVQAMLLQEPKLLPYFRGGELGELTAEEKARLHLIAAMYCDVLNIGLHEQQTISSTRSLREWRKFCSNLLETSAVLKDEVNSKPHAYPLLAATIQTDAGRDITKNNPPRPEPAFRESTVDEHRDSESDGST